MEQRTLQELEGYSRMLGVTWVHGGEELPLICKIVGYDVFVINFNKFFDLASALIENEAVEDGHIVSHPAESDERRVVGLVEANGKLKVTYEE